MLTIPAAKQMIDMFDVRGYGILTDRTDSKSPSSSSLSLMLLSIHRIFVSDALTLWSVRVKNSDRIIEVSKKAIIVLRRSLEQNLYTDEE